MYSHGVTVLTGLIDWILSGIFYVIDWIFQNVLYWLLNFVYEALIYVPLVIINTISIIFRFFCGGFANWIFGDGSQLFDPSTGQININWSFDSQLGQIVFYTFVFSFALFFIFFLISFTGNIRDENGQPVKGAMNRLKTLRWPFYMIAALFLLPYVFVLGDYLMQEIMLYFNNSQSTPFTGSDLQNIKDKLFPLFQNLSGNTWNADVMIDGSSWKFLAVINDLSGKLETLNTWIANNPDQVTAYNFGYEIDQLQQSIVNIQSYLNSGINTDFSSFQTLINGLKAGDYLSADNATQIAAIKGNLANLFNFFQNDVPSYLRVFNNTIYNDQWAVVASSGVNKTDIVDKLQGISDSWSSDTLSNSLYSTTLVPINQIANGYNADGSYTTFFSLSEMQWKVQGITDFPIVGIIYSAATGDPNPNNWTDEFGNGFSKHADVLRWVLSIFAVWGMILIVYTYTADVTKRIYYLIGYWIIGFLFLANGINDSRSVNRWYKSMINRWFGIVVAMVCFELATLLVMAIKPAVEAGLNIDKYDIGNVKVLVNIGVILSLEAGYQVGYMIYDKYMNNRSAQTNHNTTFSRPTLLSSGNQLMNSALSSAEYYGTGGPVKSVYNKAREPLEWYRGFTSRRNMRQQQEMFESNRLLEMDKRIADLKAAGYNASVNKNPFRRFFVRKPSDIQIGSWFWSIGKDRNPKEMEQEKIDAIDKGRASVNPQKPKNGPPPPPGGSFAIVRDGAPGPQTGGPHMTPLKPRDLVDPNKTSPLIFDRVAAIMNPDLRDANGRRINRPDKTGPKSHIAPGGPYPKTFKGVHPEMPSRWQAFRQQSQDTERTRALPKIPAKNPYARAIVPASVAPNGKVLVLPQPKAARFEPLDSPFYPLGSTKK